MKKQFHALLGLALLMLAWGGGTEVADAADAAATYTLVTSVNFNSDTDGTIPTGWTVVNSEEYKAATDTTGIRASGSSQSGGPRLFTFSQGLPFQKALYIRAKWPSGNAAAYDGYAYYGDLAGNTIPTLTADTQYELRVPAFLWTNDGSAKVKVDVLTYDETKKLSEQTPASALTTAISGLTSLGTVTKTLNYNVQKSQTDDLNGIETVTVRFKPTSAVQILIKVSAIIDSGASNWTEIMFGGFSLYSYTGTPSTYDDETEVFEENFTSTSNNCTPADGSGWTIYNGTTAKTKGQSYNTNGSRIFRNLTGSNLLPAAFYCASSSDYAIYGLTADGEPALTLEKAQEYFVSLYAVGWKTSQTATISILTNDDAQTEVASKSLFLLNNCNDSVFNDEKQAYVDQGSRSKTIVPEHIQFTFTAPAAGNYLLKLTASGEALIGNISIRKNTTLTTISETFAELNNASPKTGSGWTLHKDNTDTTAVANGQTQLSNQARIMAVTNGGSITASFYARYKGYLTYGEKANVPLTLVGGKEYRLTYYIGRQDTSAYAVTSQITRKEDAVQVFKRQDYSAGLMENGTVTITPDYVETSFVPDQSGDYILEFTGQQVHVANITLAENFADPIVGQTTLDANFGYSTIYFDRAITIPENVRVYVGTLNTAGDEFTVTEVTGNLPANTPAIVKGEKGATVTFEPATAVPAAIESNALSGCLVGTKLPTTAVYTFAYTNASDKSTIGFYKSEAKALRAHKAYLTGPASATIAAIRCNFGESEEPGNVSAIEQVAAASAAERPIFDLRGRRVADMSKPGLYVVGGRKVLIK